MKLKAFKLSAESTQVLIQLLGDVGRFSDLTVEDLTDPNEPCYINEDTYVLLGDNGTWQWRTVGDGFSHTEIDTTSIGGPLTTEEHVIVREFCAALDQGGVSLNSLGIAYAWHEVDAD